MKNGIVNPGNVSKRVDLHERKSALFYFARRFDMKEHKYTQCILCEGNTFQDAVNKFNTEMKRHAHLRPTFERAGETFLIYVTVVELAPETLVEAKHLDGCRHYCEDCASCVREKNRHGVIDARKKYGFCAEQDMKKIRIDQIVCDEFYTADLEMRKEG